MPPATWTWCCISIPAQPHSAASDTTWNDSVTRSANQSATARYTVSSAPPNDTETVDVMVADRLPPEMHPKALRRKVFALPGGTSALRKTVNCEVNTGEIAVVLSIPDVLGALVLKGAAYLEDSRDRGRHLDDAAVLACAVTDPIGDRARMIGSDRRRIQALWKVLQDLDHRSWIATGTTSRRGHGALRVLVGD